MGIEKRSNRCNNYKEKAFHSQRVIFVVINGEVLVNKYTDKSHREWFVQMGWMDKDDKIMEDNLRGYYDGAALYCYLGYDFREPDVKLIRDNIHNIIDKMQINRIETEVYSGVVPQLVGDKWKPLKRLGTLEDLIKQRNGGVKQYD